MRLSETQKATELSHEMEPKIKPVQQQLILVTIYNVQKWGFSSYSLLSDDFQRRFHFRAYVQFISNIRRSITRAIHMNDDPHIQWTLQYKKSLKLQLCLCIFSVLLAFVGTFTLPYLYNENLIGWTFIMFGITFCGIGLCICAIIYLHLKSIQLIKRYKYMISDNINQGLYRLNKLYSNQASFEIDKISSTRSIFKSTIDLNITFQITLLTHNVLKQSTRHRKKTLKVKRKYISKDIFNRSRSVSRASISSHNKGPGPKLDRFDSTQTETDKVVLLQMLNGETVLAHIIGPAASYNDNKDGININDMNDEFAFIELKEDSHYDTNIPIIVEQEVDTIINEGDDDEIEDKQSKLPLSKQHDEMYTNINSTDQREIDQKIEIEKSEKSENKQKLELFQSDKVYQDIVNLVNIHNNDEYDKQYNHYNIGHQIGKYLDDIMEDKNCVIVVSETNKQPQLSYVSQKGFSRKIKNISGKDIFVYRALDFIALKDQQYLTKDFKQIVLNLSQIYGSTPEIALELDNIYGGGCHVAIGKCSSYNIFCRYTDDLIARVDTKNGIFIIAWRG